MGHSSALEACYVDVLYKFTFTVGSVERQEVVGCE